MSGKINVYGLGQYGINRVKSPVHVKDGELLSAQNAQVKPVQGQLALSKRDGMAKINSSAAAGTLSAIVNLPFTDPDAIERLYNGRTGHDGTNGFAVTNTFSVTNPAALSSYFLHPTRHGTARGPNDYLYFVIPGAVLYQWDGTTASVVPSTPAGAQIGQLWYHPEEGRLYCGFVGTAVTAKVAYYDGTSWTTLATTGLGGDQYQGLVVVLDDGTVLAYAQNQGAGSNEGHVLRYTGSAWTQDMSTLDDFSFATTSRNVIQSLWTDGTDVYALFLNETAGGVPNLLIFKRSSAGVWTNISPTTISRDYGYTTSCEIYRGDLYVGYYNEAFSTIEIWKRTSAGDWSIDLDIDLDISANYLPWEMLVWRDRLWVTPEYASAQAVLLYKNPEGTWTTLAVTHTGISLSPGPVPT